MFLASLLDAHIDRPSASLGMFQVLSSRVVIFLPSIKGPFTEKTHRIIWTCRCWFVEEAGFGKLIDPYQQQNLSLRDCEETHLRRRRRFVRPFQGFGCLRIRSSSLRLRMCDIEGCQARCECLHTLYPRHGRTREAFLGSDAGYLNDEIRCADPVLSKKITRKAAADGCVC